MKLLIIGPAGSGKGTQAKKIAEKYNLAHISTGDIFRENIKNNTQLGKIASKLINDGKLVPDEITNKMVEERIKKDDCKNGYILDGFPRNIIQAKYLSKIDDVDSAIELKVSNKETVKRLSSRRTCSNCKRGYNIISLKPKIEGVCDDCSGTLIQRADDKPVAIKKRLEIYTNETKPIIEFYKQKNLLKEISGEQEINVVFEEITLFLDTL
ncbi:MAG: adenylate kinase [Nanoarchaeota archaeon]|nr:adenylate kinase [Nanoarchaeota archaeon]